jgi:hypothetical protein
MGETEVRPEGFTKIVRNTFPEPMMAAVGMLPGTRHRKRQYVLPPVCTNRAAKSL